MTAALIYLKRANGGDLLVKPQTVNAILTDMDGNTVVRIGGRGYTVQASMVEAYQKLFPSCDLPEGFDPNPSHEEQTENGEDEDQDEDEEEDEEEEVD